MGGFSAEWLALREPADHAARSMELTRSVLNALPRDAPWRILDLAAGSGSNLRYLSSVFEGPTHGSAPTPSEACEPLVGADPRVRPSWLLVDHDAALLAWVARDPHVETRRLDLSTLDNRGVFAGRALVTASALLDLVSEDWVRKLAVRSAEVSAAVLFALSYDGRVVCAPEDPEDEAILWLVNRHQQTDKGFGPALGPRATEVTARCFEALGYQVRRARSDWKVARQSRDLQGQLIDGWAQAATDMAPAREAMINAWRDRRLAHVAAGRSEITVGHEDLGGRVL